MNSPNNQRRPVDVTKECRAMDAAFDHLGPMDSDQQLADATGIPLCNIPDLRRIVGIRPSF